MSSTTPDIPVGYVSVREIVLQTLIDSGDMNTTSEYARRLSWALNELRHLGWLMEVYPEKQYVLRDLNTDLIDPVTLTAPLPQDYLMWRDVGYIIGGQLVRLTYNYQLKPYWEKDDCGNDIPNITAYNPNYLAYYYGLYNVMPWGQDYGVGGGSALGGFSIDSANSRIQFDSRFTIHYPVVMYYVSNGMGEFTHYIDARAEQCLRDFIHWQVKRFSRSAGIGEKQYAQSLYEASKYEAKNNIYAIPQFQIADLIRQTRYQAPKL